jgi:hypothetical protein
VSPLIGETGLRRKGHYTPYVPKSVQNYYIFRKYARKRAKKCKIICVIGKKAVPLHAFSAEKAKNPAKLLCLHAPLADIV